MTTHIIWAVVWFVLMLISFYGGVFGLWATVVGSIGRIAFGKSRTSAEWKRQSLTITITAVTVSILLLAFAVFSLIKTILQIVAAFQS